MATKVSFLSFKRRQHLGRRKSTSFFHSSLPFLSRPGEKGYGQKGNEKRRKLGELVEREEEGTIAVKMCGKLAYGMQIGGRRETRNDRGG